MSNEQYLTDLFIYQAESLAASDVDMIDGDDFEIEYDGGHSGDVSISGLMAEALKRLRKAEADRDRLKAELEDRSHEPEMTASDAYHHCADLIEPHVVDMPHGTECNEQSLCRSVCGSLAYLIEHWQEARGLRGERDALEALAEDRRKFIVNGVEFGYISAPSEEDEPEYHVFQECNLEPSFAAASHDARIKAEALEEAAGLADIEFWQEGHGSVEVLGRDLAEKAAEYRKQAEAREE